MSWRPFESDRLDLQAARRLSSRRRLQAMVAPLVALTILVWTVTRPRPVAASPEPLPQGISGVIKINAARGHTNLRYQQERGPDEQGLQFLGFSSRPQDPDAVAMPPARWAEYEASGTELTPAEWKAEQQPKWKKGGR